MAICLIDCKKQEYTIYFKKKQGAVSLIDLSILKEGFSKTPLSYIMNEAFKR